MSGQPGKATNRVFHVTLTDQRPDGTPKTFTMLAPAGTSQAAALASLKARFGANRVTSVI